MCITCTVSSSIVHTCRVASRCRLDASRIYQFEAIQQLHPLSDAALRGAASAPAVASSFDPVRDRHMDVFNTAGARMKLVLKCRYANRTEYLQAIDPEADDAQCRSISQVRCVPPERGSAVRPCPTIALSRCRIRVRIQQQALDVVCYASRELGLLDFSIVEHY
jgi:hypothetical protein